MFSATTRTAKNVDDDSYFCFYTTFCYNNSRRQLKYRVPAGQSMDTLAKKRRGHNSCVAKRRWDRGRIGHGHNHCVAKKRRHKAGHNHCVEKKIGNRCVRCTRGETRHEQRHYVAKTRVSALNHQRMPQEFSKECTGYFLNRARSKGYCCLFQTVFRLLCR